MLLHPFADGDIRSLCQIPYGVEALPKHDEESVAYAIPESNCTFRRQIVVRANILPSEARHDYFHLSLLRPELRDIPLPGRPKTTL